MTNIVAFSGNSNTGKTSAMRFVYDYYAEHHPEQKILLLGESAREYIEAHGGMIDNQRNFQSYVFQQEIARLDHLQQLRETDEYDIVCIDRTTMDGMIYSYWNMISGYLGAIDFVEDHYVLVERSKELYDQVIFFSTPIHVDRRFENYNNDHINAIFEHSIKWFYGDKVTTYTNNIFFQDNREQNIFGTIFGE
jgi:thymidylate kinase